MFREMRRNKQILDVRECEKILERGTSGVLAVSGDDGYPYAVPLSYVYSGGAIYFHCAKSGHKLDAIRREPKVSFCVIDKDDIVPEEFTTYYRSVIAFGKASVLEGEDLFAAADVLAVKYSPDESEERRHETITRNIPALCLVKIEIEHMTGKEAIELVRIRERGRTE